MAPRNVSVYGNTAEVKLARLLEADGNICGSRRNMPGAGDLLVVGPAGQFIQLIEVKRTKQIPWRSTFGPAERQALLQTAAEYGARAAIVWWPDLKKDPIWLYEEKWPRIKGGDLPL